MTDDMMTAMEAPSKETTAILGPLDEPGITFTPTGLKIEPWVTFEQWQQYGRKLQLAEKGIQWALGDWMIHGERRFKEMAYQAVEFTGLKLSTLQKYATVAKAIEKSRRRDSDEVDFSIHAEVVTLENEEDQDAILSEAAEKPNETTVKKVRRQVHRIKREQGKAQSELEIIHTPEVQQFLGQYLEAIKPFEEQVPLTARFLRSMIQAHIAQAYWQMNRSIAEDCEAIMIPIRKYGTVSEDDLFTWLHEHGYFMSDPELDERLEYMERDDVRMLSKTDAGKDGKQEDRRGKLPQVYVKWFKNWGEHFKQHRADDDDEDAA